MSKKYVFEDVVPHTSPMALLDDVEHWDNNSLQASVTIRRDAPLADDQGVPAWAGIEYMAQAIGAFSGIQAREHNNPVKIGFLVGSRRYNCNQSYFPIGRKLLINVEQILHGENGLCVFDCSIQGDNISADAKLNVFQPEDPEGFLKPDHSTQEAH